MEHALHRDLEFRLEALAARIASLRKSMKAARGAEKMEDFGALVELERRHQALADRLRRLNREGPGFRPEVKAEVERLTDDLMSIVDNFVNRTDAAFRPDRHGRR